MLFRKRCGPLAVAGCLGHGAMRRQAGRPSQAPGVQALFVKEETGRQAVATAGVPEPVAEPASASSCQAGQPLSAAAVPVTFAQQA